MDGSVDLYWLPLGAGGHFVRLNGRIYEAMASLPDRSIEPERSAQKLLGVTPRTTSQWLIDIDLH